MPQSSPSAVIPASLPLKYPLDFFFHPRTVAVIGATDRAQSVGRSLLENLAGGRFKGTVYAVNPAREEVFGRPCHGRISLVPEPVDLAVIAIPAEDVPQAIGECVRAGVSAAVVISAGFRELGPQGFELEQRIRQEMRGSAMRLIGPNCLGIMNPVIGLNATFARQSAAPGRMAFLSQSGALCTAILDWSMKQVVGFSAFVSTGSMLDVGWGDLIDYFGDDPNTQSILLYMESVGDPRAFLSAAREVALKKPIVVIKPGRTSAAAKAAVSHTGSMTGADEVMDAAFHRCGVLRVQTVAELFDMAEVLSKQPRPRGPRLMIVTNAGGPGVLATDALIGGGGQLCGLSETTRQSLNQLLPRHWSHGNPVDILGDASPDRYSSTLTVLGSDPEPDALLAILSPQGMTDPTAIAGRLAAFKASYPKPLLASWMGGVSVEPGLELLNRASIPTFAFPDAAASAFNYMWRYSRNLMALYETPLASMDDQPPERDVLGLQLCENRAKAHLLLTEMESKQILGSYGIASAECRHAASAEEAAVVAQEIGFPVVLKLHSATVTHKSRAGGVRINLMDAKAVREAFEAIRDIVTRNTGPKSFEGVTVQPVVQSGGIEIILGSSLDAQFGPVLLAGTGGTMAEAINDYSIGLPPLNTTLARRMVESTRIFRVIKAAYGEKGCQLLEDALVKLSRLVIENPCIREIDINPLVMSPRQITALDARIVLYGDKIPEDRLPRPAIRPYPAQYTTSFTLRDGTATTVRPIMPHDEPLMVQFHGTLSDHSVYMRYFQVSSLRQRVAHERLARQCFIDYDREMALVAVTFGPEGRKIVGVGRLIKLHGRNQAEIALLISDKYQRQGLGAQFLKMLMQVGRDENLECITAYMQPVNLSMQALVTKNGFVFEKHPDQDTIIAKLDLGIPAAIA